MRLDWNLSDRHKASFRWSLVSARQLNGASDADHLNASSFSYDFVSLTDSYVLELQSRLSNSVSNEFLSLIHIYFPFEFLREPVDEQVFPVGFGPCVGDARFYQLAELFVSLRAVVRRGAEVFEPDEGPAIPV